MCVHIEKLFVDFKIVGLSVNLSSPIGGKTDLYEEMYKETQTKQNLYEKMIQILDNMEKEHPSQKLCNKLNHILYYMSNNNLDDRFVKELEGWMGQRF